MAFLDDSGVQSQTQTQGSPGQAAGGGGAPTVSGAGGSDVGGVSTAGVGAGGTGGWTNIQSYLQANQGDNGSANNLRDTVGSQFNKESGQMQDAADKTVKDASNYVNDSNISSDQANDLIGQASKAYSYPGADGTGKGGMLNSPSTGGTGDFSTTPYQKATAGAAPTQTNQQVGVGDNPSYQGIVDRFHTALNGQWGMPSSFSYGLGAQTQNYGDQVNNDQGFQGMMGKLYSDKAGAPLTSGQSALQNQFDSGNQSLANARHDLQGQYQGLQNKAGQLSQDTTNTLGADQNQFVKNQNTLRDYLGQQAGNYDTNIGKAQDEARANYNTDYTTGQSGDSAINYQNMINNQNAGGLSGSETQARIAQRQGMGIWGDNLTYQQLQNEQNDRYSGGDLSPWQNNELYGSADNRVTSNADWANRADQLGNWYGSEDAKYANTGDADKRSFNSIQDFLGANGTQKSQGFNVRG